MEKNKIFIFIIIGILFTTVIAVSVALFFTLNSLKTIAGSNAQSSNNEGEIKVKPEDVSIFSISEPITANLIVDKDDEERHILRISIGLALDSSQKDFDKLNEQLTGKMDIIRHKIISVIRNKSYEDVKQPNIQELMVEEILNELKKEFQTDTIIDIYFGEFFVQ
jgi:flagellar basal body-associated protein FliL